MQNSFAKFKRPPAEWFNVPDLVRTMTLCLGLCFVMAMTSIGIEAAEDTPEMRPVNVMELEIEDLAKIQIETVTSASKSRQKVTEAPSSVTIITADEIRKYGYRTLADILKSVKGFFVTYDRNYSYLGVRGFGRAGDYNNRFLLLVDGHRMNEAIQEQAFIGNEFILDVDLIDRVEVVPGPSSSLYGGNAFFGVINVISKKGPDMKSTELSGSAGSFDAYKGRISYGSQLNNNIEVLLSGSAYDSKGNRHLYYPEFDFPDANNGVAVNNDYENYVNFFEKISFSDFILEGGYITREKGIPTGSWARVFNESGNRSIDTRGFLELKYNHNIAGSVDIMARAYYDYFSFKGEYVYDSLVSITPPYTPPFFINKDYFEGQWWGAEVMLMKIFMENHTLTMGAEYKDNFKQNQTNYDQDPYLLNLDDRRRSDSWGVYAQDEYAIIKNLLINLGVRYDHYSILNGKAGEMTNPRAALIYNPLEKTTFKLLYGTAFRAPNAFELYYNYPACGLVANSNLKPEKITTYELVYEQYLGDHLRSSVSGFTYKVKDRVVLLPDPSDPVNVFSFQNNEVVSVKGVDLELNGRWAGGLEGTVNYTIQQAKSDTTGERIPNSPRHMAKLKMVVPLLNEKLFAGIEEQYMGERRTDAGNEVDGFYITNVTLFSRAILKRAELSASVYNLFDNKYADPGSKEHIMDAIEQDGRTWNAKVTYAF